MQYLTRCIDDQITVNAGYLAYVTLLSIVPLVAVGVAIFSAFPGFESTITIENFLFTNLVPTSSDVIKEHISAFAGNANKMTAVGVGFLAAVSLLLIRNVDATLNRIWRIKKTPDDDLICSVLDGIKFGAGLVRSKYWCDVLYCFCTVGSGDTWLQWIFVKAFTLHYFHGGLYYALYFSSNTRVCLERQFQGRCLQLCYLS